MATEVSIRGAGSTAKIRNPIAVPLLILVTLGIYGIFWYYFINRELADLGRAKGTDELGDSPGTSVLAVTLGALIIVPAIISIWNTCKRVQAAQRLAGRPEPMSAGLAFVLLLLLSPVGDWFVQNELNKVWQAEGEPVEGGASGQIGAPPPPPPPAAEAPEVASPATSPPPPPPGGAPPPPQP